MVCKSLLAAVVISGKASSGLFKQILTCSLPQVAWGEEVSPEIISAVNRSAWDNAHSTSEQMWVNSFVLADTLPKKLELLVHNCPDKDLGTQAIEQLIANESRERMAAFALAVFPAASLGILPIGSEGVHDLGQIAIPVFSVDGEIKWQERTNTSNTQHPEFLRYAKVLENLEGARRQLASQLFNWCLVNNLVLPAPDQLEEEMNKCVHIIRSLD